MRRVFIFLYMLFVHPVLFFKYTIKGKSRGFLANGRRQHIKTSQLDISKNVRVGYDTRVNFYDKGRLCFGEGCYMGNRNSFLVGGDITLGKNVLLASDVCVVSESHGIDPEDEKPYGVQPLIVQPVCIGDGCWIAEKVMILPGVTIGEKSIIGAGSVVTKSIPPFSIACGNPAKVIKQYDFETKEWRKFDE